MKQNKKYLVAASVFALAVLGGCNADTATGEWIAKVGGSPIMKSSLEAKVAELSPEIKQQIQTNDQARIQVVTRLLDGLVSDKLILEDAKHNGYEANADYVAALQQLETQVENEKKRLEKIAEDQKRQALITLYLQENIDSKITVTDQEVVDVYNNNKARFAEYELRQASHILVSDRDEANSLRAQLRRGANFENLAREHSIDRSTAERGGDVGEFTQAGSPAEFIEVAYAIQRVGTISNVFESPLGFHILKLTNVRTVPERKLEDVAQELRRNIFIAKRNQALQTLITELREKYPIELRQNENAEQTAQAN